MKSRFIILTIVFSLLTPVAAYPLVFGGDGYTVLKIRRGKKKADFEVVPDGEVSGRKKQIKAEYKESLANWKTEYRKAAAAKITFKKPRPAKPKVSVVKKGLSEEEAGDLRDAEAADWEKKHAPHWVGDVAEDGSEMLLVRPPVKPEDKKKHKLQVVDESGNVLRVIAEEEDKSASLIMKDKYFEMICATGDGKKMIYLNVHRDSNPPRFDLVLLDVKSGEKKTIFSDAGIITRPCFDPQEKHIGLRVGKTIHCWDLSGENHVKREIEGCEPMDSCALLSEGKNAVFVFRNKGQHGGGNLGIINLESGKIHLLDSAKHPSGICKPMVSPDGKMVAYHYQLISDQPAFELRICSVKGGGRKKLGTHDRVITKGFSRKGRYFVVRQYGGPVKLLRVK